MFYASGVVWIIARDGLVRQGAMVRGVGLVRKALPNEIRPGRLV